MSGRFVRSSKYRHVFGRPTRKEQCYDNLKVSRNAWDSNLVKANPDYIAVNWDAAGGGAFAVIPVEERGKVGDRIPLFRGHTAVVLDTDWNPFHDSLIASGSDDGKVFLWRVPDDFTVHPDCKPEEVQDVAPVGKLPGHPRKVGHVLFNPAAENVLASASGDFTIKLWDIEQGQARLNLKVGEVIQSMSWSANGSLLVTTSRDKKLRIWDTRQERAAHEVAGHQGAKNSRSVWMGEHDRIATTGFSKMSDRQLALWDIKAPNNPLGGFQMLDSISGVCVPFWDDGTQCLYLAGKGDGNIRYYEYENDEFQSLSEYKSGDPQRGIAFVPKRGVNTHENEVMRAYKTVNDNYIEPISFIVPRRAEAFQDDIYPPTNGLKPAMSSAEWFEGGEALPPKFSMEALFEGKGLKDEVEPTQNPAASTKSAATAPAPAERPVEEQTSTQSTVEPASARKGPEVVAPPKSTTPVSMKDQGKSMSSMVDKYADEEQEEEVADDSSFEEIAKPVERPAVKSVPADVKKEDVGTSIPTTTTKEVEKIAPMAPPEEEEPIHEAVEEKTAAPTTASTSAASSTTDVAALERELKNMKTVMAQQIRQMASMQVTIQELVSVVKGMQR